MTTSSCSANALGLPDRRRLLATFAGAGALGLPALPALAAAPGPIEAMWSEHCRLEALHGAAIDRLIEAEERYDEPARPDWHPFRDEGGSKVIPTAPGRGLCVLDDSEENVAHLKSLIAREFEPGPDEVGCPRKLIARRARKTLARIETWKLEVRRRKDAAGLTEAEAIEAAASKAARDQRDAMLAIEATTLRELAHQAAILTGDWRDCKAGSVLEQFAELVGVTPFHLV